MDEVANEGRLVRIEATLEQIRNDQAEMRAYLTQVISEMRKTSDETADQVAAQKLFCAARQPQNTQLAEAHGKLERRVEKLEELAPAMRAVIWIGAALGGSMIALIWAVIIGRATLTFIP